MAAELLVMKEAALEYMDRSGALQKFVEDCSKYNDSKQCYAVYRFLLTVNPCDIAELNATLGNYVLHEPMKAVQIFQSVCARSIHTLSLIPQLQTETQIKVELKLTHLPSLPCYLLSLCEFPFDHSSRRFYMLEGIVIAMTTVTKYTQGARFLCSEESCPFSEGFQYIRVHTPGATESATVRNDFVCNLCTSPLKEDMKFRVLGDKQLVEMMDVKCLQSFQGFSSNQPRIRFQSFTVFLRDELSNKMKIGGRYRVIGIPASVQNSSQNTICMESNSIDYYIPQSVFSISDRFKSLHSMTLSSPWKFTAILINNFASSVVPLGTYNTLKLCMLLSLVQTCDEQKESMDYLDLLVVTSDTLIVDRLLSYSVCLVPRGIRHLTFSELFAIVTKDEHGTGTASIQAGSALLAKGGICFIGELSSYKKDKLDLLQSVLDSRSITVFIPGKKYGEDVDQQITFPVQCSFWSFVAVDSSSTRHGQKDTPLIGQMDLSFAPANLVDDFGLLIHCNESSLYHPVLPLVYHSLRKAMDPEGPLSAAFPQFTMQDYAELIDFAKNLEVELSPAVEKLIHGYYLASRRVRTNSIHGSKLSASALKNLISLSKAHAKLSLRKKVLEEDALIAVLLFEASLTVKHGTSVFCVAPNALFPFDLYDEDCLQQRDEYLMQYYDQLLQFIATYGPATPIFTTEE
ncbi:minichromosome maintenance domain-containing protein 2 [Microcaecilia unicolor]|uniref:Minichromosome maintenance domain-containing protein 2 n=1 Tax=Microcaecilia unicolor TaxID=1415580 RepID=A0A6P7WS65_9AMPH|nr:minichromosome maintenance domain-containing protein 2 [Microcaecilia unicolor]